MASLGWVGLPQRGKGAEVAEIEILTEFCRGVAADVTLLKAVGMGW